MASEFRTRRWTKPRICVPTPLSVFFIEITFPSSPSPIILFKPHRHLFNYFSSLLPCCFTTLCIRDSFVVQNRSGFAKRFEKVAKSRIVASPLNFRLITYARYLSLSPRPRSVLVNQSKRSVGTHTQYLQYTHPFRFHLWSLNICPLDQSWSNFLLPLVKPTYIYVTVRCLRFYSFANALFVSIFVWLIFDSIGTRMEKTGIDLLFWCRTEISISKLITRVGEKISHVKF